MAIWWRGMTKIFISYRRSNSEDVASECVHLKDEFGEKVFKDVYSIKPGHDFRQALTNAVQLSDVVLAVIGERWLTASEEHGDRRLGNPDYFVRLELETALARPDPDHTGTDRPREHANGRVAAVLVAATQL